MKEEKKQIKDNEENLEDDVDIFTKIKNPKTFLKRKYLEIITKNNIPKNIK